METVTHIYFSHPKAQKYYDTFNVILLGDTTFNTTKEKIPLLNVVGRTFFNKTFMACQALMPASAEEDYAWFCEQIDKYLFKGKIPKVFETDDERAFINAIVAKWGEAGLKHLLCTWHIDCNVRTVARPFFIRGSEGDELFAKFILEWQSTRKKITLPAFETAWVQLQQDYPTLGPVFSYINKEKLCEFKKYKFLSCLTQGVMHMKEDQDGRVESSHRVVKLYAGTSAGSVSDFFFKNHEMLEAQFSELDTQMAIEKTTIRNGIQSVSIFKSLLGKVSSEAFARLVEEKRNFLRSQRPPTTQGIVLFVIFLICFF